MERLPGFAALPAPAAYLSLAPGAKWAVPIVRLRGVAAWRDGAADAFCVACSGKAWRVCMCSCCPGSSGILYVQQSEELERRVRLVC